MIPWNYPGIVSVGATTQFYLPAEGNFGRNNGAVVWGDVVDNKLTYLVGAFDNGDVAKTPLYSARVRLALWDTEPGFWGNASFFGDKNMLSLGVGGQYEKVPMGTNYEEFNADVLLEKKIPGEIAWVLRVDGHTDVRPINSPQFKNNWELSSARAISVVQYLVSKGVSPQRLVAAGFGEFQPIDPDKTEDAFTRNRRIELKLTER